MKKIIFMMLLGITLPSIGAFIKDAQKIFNVTDAKEMADDTPVFLQGHIIQQLEDDKYLFKDETDEIIVEIGKKAWNKVDVRSSDIIQLEGEVDKDFADDIEIDVKRVIPVQVKENSETESKAF